MDEERNEGQEKKGAWQQRKEGWYDNLNVSVRQLDIIIAVASAMLVGVAVLIALEAKGIIG